MKKYLSMIATAVLAYAPAVFAHMDNNTTDQGSSGDIYSNANSSRTQTYAMLSGNGSGTFDPTVYKSHNSVAGEGTAVRTDTDSDSGVTIVDHAASGTSSSGGSGSGTGQ